MDRHITLLFSLCMFASTLLAQRMPLTYYLPDIEYDSDVPTPESVLGYQVGEWHVSHDQLLYYYRTLAAAAPDRIKLEEHGRTYENRPLIHLIITSPENHARLEEIRQQHLALCDPSRSAGLDTRNMPVVLYQGFSIHGNEASGANGALLVAYYLAAGKSQEVETLLQNAVIIFDPCFNPDGLHRFSTWANMHKNRNLTADNADREYNEAWPGGRTNHYWFDLNRDWLPAQHPESQGRIALFQRWKPNVLTDHHEMGTNSTFFFMPGVQTRINPITPKENQELTAKIATFHAKALDKIGSLYYTEEGYDDFYYGKGSTYPDAQGCIGILFEQASSRGHLQQTDNGPLSFPFTIRNQITTALSTHEAIIALRQELLDFQREFYRSALEEARRDQRRGFVVGESHDASRLQQFVAMLQRQEIRVHQLARSVTLNGKRFEPGKAYVIPFEQPQYRLIQGIFQRETTFEDSLFYDISAWTMPLAFNLEYEAAGTSFSNILGEPVKELPELKGRLLDTSNDYAWAFDWDPYYAPAALYHLLRHNLLVKVAGKPFTALTASGQRTFTYGAIIVPRQNQPLPVDSLRRILADAARLGMLDIHGISTGLTPAGSDLGSRYMEALRLPKVALVVGEGITSYDAGEIWHLLDTRYQMPVTKVEADNLNEAVLSRFNVLILPGGRHRSINAEAIRNWLRAGNVLIALENATEWVANQKLMALNFKKTDDADTIRRPYDALAEDRGALNLSGAIFEADLDLTHPLCYGYRRSKLPIFRSSNRFLEPVKNPYANPIVYTDNPLMAGYMHRKFRKVAPGSASAVVGGVGAGRIICLTDNTCFRAFWYGTNKIMANAIFFGHTISGQAAASD